MSKIDRLEELTRIRLLLKSLSEHAGYEVFQKDMLQVLVTREQEIVAPPSQMTNEALRTYLAGEIAGIRYGLNYLVRQIQHLDQEIDHLNAQLTREEDSNG